MNVVLEEKGVAVIDRVDLSAVHTVSEPRSNINPLACIVKLGALGVLGTARDK